MWLKVNPPEGSTTRYVNLKEATLVDVIEGMQDGEAEVKITIATQTKTFGINNSEKQKLQHYLDTITYYEG